MTSTPAATYHAQSRKLRRLATRFMGTTLTLDFDDAADAIDTLVAERDRLEACLADVCRQLEMGGVK